MTTMPAPWEHALSQYLTRHAEPTANAVLALCARMPRYASSAVLVAFDEASTTVQRLLERGGECRFGPVLLIVVVNEPTTARPEQRQRNRLLLSTLKASGSTAAVSDDGALTWVSGRAGLGVDLLIVDACTSTLRLGDKEGVGRARKLGFDAALSLHRSGNLSGSYCGSLDADVQVAPNYWDVLCQHSDGALPRYGALLFDYEHVPSGRELVDRTMQGVELHFRCFVLGLAHAGSPWAYHALGSALAVSLPHYAIVRGVPNRLAGEDFYLLQKLGRVAPLARVGEVPIAIQTRTSDRVPFGTGPVLAESLSKDKTQNAEVMTYAPRVYTSLREYLSLLEQWIVQGAPPQNFEISSWDPELVSSATSLSERMSRSLNQCKTADTRRRRLHESFGALATLQFVRRMSARSTPMVRVEEAAGLLIDEQSVSGNDQLHRTAPGLVGALERGMTRARSWERRLPRVVGPAVAGATQVFDIYRQVPP